MLRACQPAAPPIIALQPVIKIDLSSGLCHLNVGRLPGMRSAGARVLQAGSAASVFLLTCPLRKGKRTLSYAIL